MDVEKKYLLVSDARKSFENNAKNEDKVLAEATREKTKIISVLKGPRWDSVTLSRNDTGLLTMLHKIQYMQL